MNATKPEHGSPAPDFRVELADGRTVALRDYNEQPLLLIFLRHLA